MTTLNPAGQALLARAIAGERIAVVQLVFIDATVPQYWAACGTGPIEWGGHDWVASDIGITEIEDTVNGLNGQTLTLPGVTPAELAFAFDDLDGVTIQLFDAWIDPDTKVVADAPLTFTGELDVPGWQDGAEATVILTAVHAGNAALRPKSSLWTNDEQQRLHPGDTCLNTEALTDAAPLVWPAASFFKQS